MPRKIDSASLQPLFSRKVASLVCMRLTLNLFYFATQEKSQELSESHTMAACLVYASAVLCIHMSLDVRIRTNFFYIGNASCSLPSSNRVDRVQQLIPGTTRKSIPVHRASHLNSTLPTLPHYNTTTHRLMSTTPATTSTTSTTANSATTRQGRLPTADVTVNWVLGSWLVGERNV